MITQADIKLVKEIASDKSVRKTERLFEVEGAKCVARCSAAVSEVARLFATDEFPTDCKLVERVSSKAMERISSLRTPTDLLALGRMPHNKLPQTGSDELVLALDAVQDPGNLGTIIRVADWYGILHVVCSLDSADCYNPKVVQASMGALLRVEVSYVGLAEWLGSARKSGVELYGTALEGENIYSATLARSGVIVMGNEGHGISSSTSALITRRLFVPPFPIGRQGSESLNVGVATAVVCNEFRRRM